MTRYLNLILATLISGSALVTTLNATKDDEKEKGEKELSNVTLIKNSPPSTTEQGETQMAPPQQIKNSSVFITSEMNLNHRVSITFSLLGAPSEQLEAAANYLPDFLEYIKSPDDQEKIIRLLLMSKREQIEAAALYLPTFLAYVNDSHSKETIIELLLKSKREKIEAAATHLPAFLEYIKSPDDQEKIIRLMLELEHGHIKALISYPPTFLEHTINSHDQKETILLLKKATPEQLEIIASYLPQFLNDKMCKETQSRIIVEMLQTPKPIEDIASRFTTLKDALNGDQFLDLDKNDYLDLIHKILKADLKHLDTLISSLPDLLSLKIDKTILVKFIIDDMIKESFISKLKLENIKKAVHYFPSFINDKMNQQNQMTIFKTLVKTSLPQIKIVSSALNSLKHLTGFYQAQVIGSLLITEDCANIPTATYYLSMWLNNKMNDDPYIIFNFVDTVLRTPPQKLYELFSNFSDLLLIEKSCTAQSNLVSDLLKLSPNKIEPIKMEAIRQLVKAANTFPEGGLEYLIKAKLEKIELVTQYISQFLSNEMDNLTRERIIQALLNTSPEKIIGVAHYLAYNTPDKPENITADGTLAKK